MAIEIIVPRLGWSMDEGTLAEWLKQDGAFVQAGEMLFVLEGDKASQEIESFDEGVLHIPPGAPQPGDTVVVGQLLGYLLAEGEAAPTEGLTARPASVESQPAAKIEVPASKSSERTTSPRPPGAPSNSRMIATPRARRKARDLGILWNDIQGTGRHGRVRERDVLARAGQSRTAGDAAAAELPAGSTQPASAIRRMIAQRMATSASQTVPVTLTTKVNAQGLVACRAQLRSERSEGILPSYTDILVSLVAAALPECPALNACWHNDGVYLFEEVHIAVAVDSAQGLLAPVLRDAATLTLDAIARQSRMLAQQARAGQLAPDQLRGGTFTITNLGMHGIDFFTPIINLPQAAILGVGRIVDEPVIEERRVVPGKTMGLSLTFDHRMLDGAPAARWLQELSRRIEAVRAETFGE